MTEAEFEPTPGCAPAAAVDDPRRFIPLEAVFNFRDVGGYRLGDGRTIGWGRLYRSGGLQHATDADIDVFDAIGLRTVIDLRSSSELDERGRFPVERHPVSFHHLPIMDRTWIADEVPTFSDDDRGAVEFLVWAYRDMLADGADRFAHAIQLLAVPGGAPAVVHCAAGKDRTGLLIALILAGLGVDDSVVVADFARSGAATAEMFAWYKAQADAAGSDVRTPPPRYMLSAHPEAMEIVLADLRRAHGSIPAYLSTLGVGRAVLEELATSLAG